MSIRRFEIELFSVTSSKPFESVVAALKAAIGRCAMIKFHQQHQPCPAQVSTNHLFQLSEG